jgi:hypothetical protein
VNAHDRLVDIGGVGVIDWGCRKIAIGDGEKGQKQSAGEQEISDDAF